LQILKTMRLNADSMLLSIGLPSLGSRMIFIN
jgi:hypothetical protein